jgi:hypothetical protein
MVALAPAVSSALLGDLAWNDWLTILSLAVALVSLFLVFRADRRASAAEERERAADWRAVSAERRAEQSESRDKARFAAEQGAELEIIEAAFEAYPPHGNRTYRARMRNVGSAPARNVRVWIVDGENPNPLGLLEYRDYVSAITVTPGEPRIVDLGIGAAVVTNSLRFVYSWTDGLGDFVGDGPMCPRTEHPVFGFALVRWPNALPRRPGKPPKGV